MLLYKLFGRIRHQTRSRMANHSPPEFFNTIKTDDSFDVFHPPLRGGHTGCLGNGCLGKGGYRCLGQIAAFCGRRVEPECPGGTEGVLSNC